MEIGNEQLMLTNRKNTSNGSSQAFNENKNISNINALLQSNQRRKALEEFELLTKTCNDATISENCIKWLQLCCKPVMGNLVEEIAGIKLFSKILVVSAEFPELGRQVAHSVTGRFLELFSNHFSCHREGWNALETLLLKYHGSFAAHKKMLEDLLKNTINKPEAISIDQARCFALFPLGGGGGPVYILYKRNWRELFDKLLYTCHQLLNLLFKNVDEFHVYDASNSFTLNIPDDTLNSLMRVFSNCCLLLQYMLLGPFPVAKEIPVDAVLKLISRCLSISEITLRNKKSLITDDLYVSLPTVHYDMVQTLSALVVCCKKTLLPVSSTISKILEQALQNAAISKKLAISVYSCLSNWLVSAGGSVHIHQLKKSLIPFILSDLQQKRGAVILRGKDKLKAPVRDKLDQFSWDEKLCYSALKTLESLLNTVGYKLEVHQHKMLQSVLLGIAFALDTQRATNASKWMYRSSIRCREMLYSVIIQLCLEPNPNWPPPTQYALKVLNEGLNDNSPAVAKTCLIGTTMLQRIIYPEFLVGSFPQNYQNDAHETEKQINEPSAMDVDAMGCLTVTNPECENKTPTRLVTKTCSPWESLSFKRNNLDIEVPSDDIDVTKINENIQAKIPSAAETPPISSPAVNIELPMDKKNDSPIKTKIVGNTDSSVSLKASHTEIQDNERQKRSGSISSQSSIGDVKLDSPMALRSGTILASPSNNELQRLNSASPLSTSSDANLMNSLVKKNNIFALEDNIETAATDLSSHMSLRSGTLLGSQPTSEKARRSSISSQNSISYSQKKIVRSSPVLEEEDDEEDEEIIFDDTIRDDYY